MLSDWIDIIATAVLSVVGLYLANGYRRQVRVHLAEVRRAAYAQLWEITGLAAPTRLDDVGEQGALTVSERFRLYEQLTSWYFRDGNGMLLEETTRRMYLDAKHNLTCPVKELRPQGLLELLPKDLDEDVRRGCLSMRQLSLLRTQMKVDLAILGEPYVRHLAHHERRFLTHCGVDLRRKPWRAAARGEPSTEHCDEG